MYRGVSRYRVVATISHLSVENNYNYNNIVAARWSASVANVFWASRRTGVTARDFGDESSSAHILVSRNQPQPPRKTLTAIWLSRLVVNKKKRNVPPVDFGKIFAATAVQLTADAYDCTYIRARSKVNDYRRYTI